MGKKWGSNEGIQIGDIFRCWGAFWSWAGTERAEYYQVVALKGKTQVVLHAIHTESRRIDEGIPIESPLHWKNLRKWPMPGQFLTEDDVEATYGYGVRVEKDGKEVQFHRAEVTAWVCPRGEDPHFFLREVGWGNGIDYTQADPGDWEPWDADLIQALEQKDPEAARRLTEWISAHPEFQERESTPCPKSQT